MSGGAFDYNCFRISDFADDLLFKIKRNFDDDGQNFLPNTISLISTTQQKINTAAKLAKEIEWLYSGDIGEETFSESVKKILEYEPQPADG